MKLLYGVIPTLVILSVILISYPYQVEAQALESKYAFDIFIVMDAVNIADAIQIKEAFKNKSETYPLGEYFKEWNQHRGKALNGDHELVRFHANFIFENKNQCIEFYNWIIDNMPQDIKDNILYGRILVTENTHHYPDNQIRPDVIIFENTIGDISDAHFEI